MTVFDPVAEPAATATSSTRGTPVPALPERLDRRVEYPLLRVPYERISSRHTLSS